MSEWVVEKGSENGPVLKTQYQQENRDKARKLPTEIAKPRIPTTSWVFENLLTFEELLELLRHQYSRYTVYRWVQRYGMPHKRIRGKLWFPKAEVIQWLERSSS